MKRLIGIFIVVCLTASLCPSALAVQQDYIRQMTMDEFSDYALMNTSYKLTMSAAAYGEGVAFNGQGVEALWFVKEEDGNIALSFPDSADLLYRVQTTTGAAGRVIASVRVKPLGEYERLTLQVTDTSGQPVTSARFDTTSSGTKVNYSDGDVGTNEYPSNIAFDNTLIPAGEWSTVKFTIDTAARTYGLSVISENNIATEIVSNVKFRYYGDTSKGVNAARIVFAVNRGISDWYSNGCLFDDFHIYIDDKIERIVGTAEGLGDETVYVIEDETEAGGSYSLSGKTVTAILESGAEYNASVDWEDDDADVDTSTVGENYPYFGTVTDDDGTQFRVRLDLDVKPLTVSETEENIKVYLGRDTDEKMPQKVKVKYSNGNCGFENVTWNSEPDLTEAVQTVTGVVGELEVNAEVHAYDTNTPVIDMDLSQYTEGYILRNFPWTLKTAVGIVASEFPANSGNMAMRYAKETDKSTGAVSYGYACISSKEASEGITVASCDLYLPSDVNNFLFDILNVEYTKTIAEIYMQADGTVKIGDNRWENVFPTEEWFNIKCIGNQNEAAFDLFINNVLIAEDVAYKSQGSMGIIRFTNRDTSNTDFIAYADNIKMYALSDILDAAWDEMIFTDAAVTDSLTMPVPSDEDVSAVWSSSDESTIGTDGTVVRPSWGSGDKTVTMSVVLTKNIGAYTVSKSKDIVLTVKEAQPTDAQAVANTLSSLTFEKIKNENTDEHNIMTDLTLPSAGEFNTVISWSSEPAGLIDSEGRVYAPKSSDTTVNLTATVSRGSVTETKQFPALTVKYQAELSDLQAVRRAMAELSVPSYASSSLSLPASGADGVKISWTSNNLSALSNSGVYKNPPRETTVTLTAILTKGSVRETKAFTVQVAAYFGGDSGGGGGGGIGGGAMTAPAVTPVTEPEKITPIYSDIEEYGWAKTAIYALTKEGVLTGTGNGRFEPERNVNREEFVAMAVRGFDITAEEKEFPFTDVSENDWHFETTKRAWSFGLISGISENSFGSGMEIKRQDIFVIMYNIVKELGISLKKVREAAEFTDSGDISDYALEAVSALYEAGIVNGYGDTIKPLKSATRAEAAKMIYEISRLQ